MLKYLILVISRYDRIRKAKEKKERKEMEWKKRERKERMFWFFPVTIPAAIPAVIPIMGSRIVVMKFRMLKYLILLIFRYETKEKERKRKRKKKEKEKKNGFFPAGIPAHHGLQNSSDEVPDAEIFNTGMKQKEKKGKDSKHAISSKLNGPYRYYAEAMHIFYSHFFLELMYTLIYFYKFQYEKLQSPFESKTSRIAFLYNYANASLYTQVWYEFENGYDTLFINIFIFYNYFLKLHLH
jgi:hypothetical protein